MAINKKLIHFNKKESFNTELANNNILNTSIVFIKDSKEIWTHGQLYATQLTTAEIEAIVANSPSVEDALAQIAAEVTARDKAVMAEKHRAEQAEATLSANIEAEITRSTAKDEAHTAAINKEVQDRTNAIATEVTNRDAAIEVETNRALDAERTLQTNINSANTAISNEVTRATEAEQLIQTNLTTEINRAKAAEQSLDSKITDHTNITDTALALKADKSDTYTKSQVDQKVSGLYKVKGSSIFEDLPKTNAVGDTYNITNSFTLNEVVYPAGTNIVYTGNGWDALSGVFDTTALEGSIQTVADNLTKESVRAKEAESALSTSIANEVTNRTQADTAMRSNITTLTNKVNANEIKLSTIQGDYKTEGSINKALEDAKAYTNSVISGLDSTITGSSKNVIVEVTETDGKLFNVAVSQSDIASAKELSDLDSRLSIVETNYVTTDTKLTIDGAKTFSNQIVSTVAKNTAPISVLSTTLCPNLNASLLDGNDSVHQYLNNAGSHFAGSASASYGLVCQITRTLTSTSDFWAVFDVYRFTNSASHGIGRFSLKLRTSNATTVSFATIAFESNFTDIANYITATYKITENNVIINIYAYSSGWNAVSVKGVLFGSWITTNVNVKYYKNSYNGDPSITFTSIPEDETKFSVSNIINNVESYDWYGVSWSENNSDPTCTRIGNMAMHRSLPILSAMKQYAIHNSFSDSIEQNIISPYDSVTKKYEYTPKDNSQGKHNSSSTTNIMVKIPEFWYIDDYVAGTKTHNLKISQHPKAGWNHHKEAYVGAYEGSIADTYLFSRIGHIPTVNEDRDTLRTAARKNNAEGECKWNIYTYEEHRAICHLFLVEYATRNCQAPVNTSLTADGFKQGGLGVGITIGAMNDVYSFVPTGTSDSLGNGSGQVAYTATNGTTYYVPRYRGIENPFGHIWKYCDDVITQIVQSGYRTVYKCEDPSQFATNKNAKYKPICSFASNLKGWKKEIKATSNCDFFTESTGGSESTYWCDYSYDNDDKLEHCLMVGGSAGSNGGWAGLFYFDFRHATNRYSSGTGSRLTYLPWAE